jgi:hypothetical protein
MPIAIRSIRKHLKLELFEYALECSRRGYERAATRLQPCFRTSSIARINLRASLVVSRVHARRSELLSTAVHSSGGDPANSTRHDLDAHLEQFYDCRPA